MKRFVLWLGLGAFWAFAMMWSDAAAEDAASLLKQPGHHLLIRHALAPGMGDPDGFELGDCQTQRNLNEAGRAQARALGQTLREAGVEPTQILSSGWCRTLDTGEEMGLGDVTAFEPLSSIWTTPEDISRKRTQGVKERLARQEADETLILITHAVNISALTGRSAGSGEGYVIMFENGRVEIVAPFQP